MTMPEAFGFTEYSSGGVSQATSLTYGPPPGIVDGEWMIILHTLNAPSSNTFTTPTGWTVIYPGLGTIGTMRLGMYAKQYSSSDSTYNIPHSGVSRHLQGLIFGLHNGQAFAEWLIGVGKARTDASPVDTTSTTTPPSITTTDPDSVVLTIAFERTAASETGITGITGGAVQEFFSHYSDANRINSILVASKEMTSPGASGNQVITYPNTSTASAWGVQIAIPGTVSAPVAYEAEVADGLGASEPASVYIWDGSAEVPVQDVLALSNFPYTVADMEADFTANRFVYWAHRGGSLNWPWFSMRAYTNAVWHGAKVLEASVWKTTDGVYAMSHDNDRAINTNATGNITAATWASVLTDVIDTVGGISGETTQRLETLLEAYGRSHVIVLEDKQNVNVPALITLVNNILGADATQHVVFKFTVQAGSGSAPGQATAAGFKTWMYSYDTEMAAIASYQSQFNYLGHDRASSSGNWATVVGYGKPVIAHLIDTPAHVTTVQGYGAKGGQVRDVLAVVPKINELP